MKMNRCLSILLGVLAVAVSSTSAKRLSDEETLTRLENSYTDTRRYNEVCWLTAHNAHVSEQDGWLYAQQSLDFKGQFEYGVRSFMIDLHWYKPLGSAEPYIALCHEDLKAKEMLSPVLGEQNCLVTRLALFAKSPKPVTYFFDQVHDWLESDPNTIITVHLESYLGPDSSHALHKALETSKVQDYIYVPVHGQRWPTLGELRQSNKRLIIFSDNVADSCIYTQAYRETRYDLGTYPGCEMRMDRRGKSSSLFVMNHFYKFSYDVPGVGTSFDEINAFEKISTRINECYKTQKRLPNFIAADFVEEGANGGARKAVLMLNSLPPENFNRFIDPVAQKSDKPHAHEEL